MYNSGVVAPERTVTKSIPQSFRGICMSSDIMPRNWVFNKPFLCGHRRVEGNLKAAQLAKEETKTPFIGPKRSACGIGWPTVKRSMWTWSISSKGNIIADRDSILTHLWLINQNETFPDSRRLPPQHLTPSVYQIHCHWTLFTLSDIR